MSSKRRIGGHFGSALQAATKKQKAGWREEIGPDEAPVVAVGDNSDSEDAIIDPGTPLPDSPDPEPPEPAADAAAIEAAANEETPAAAPSADAAVVADGPPAEAVAEKAPPPALRGCTASAVLLCLELVVDEVAVGSFKVLLPGGLSAGLEKQLASCLPPSGSMVEAISPGAFCSFAGHGPIAATPAPAQKGAAGAEADGDGGAAVAPMVQHNEAGLLTTPRGGLPGLALTLGPVPHLDASHEALGSIVSGGPVLRRLQVCAPLSGEQRPRKRLTVRIPARPETAANGAAGGEASGSHPFLLLEPAPADILGRALELEPPAAGADAAADSAEVVNLAELEIDGRDEEVAALKSLAFSRERAVGVQAVEEALAAVRDRLAGLEGVLDEAQAGRRMWQQERASHLLRVLGKLR